MAHITVEQKETIIMLCYARMIGTIDMVQEHVWLDSVQGAVVVGCADWNIACCSLGFQPRQVKRIMLSENYLYSRCGFGIGTQYPD